MSLKGAMQFTVNILRNRTVMDLLKGFIAAFLVLAFFLPFKSCSHCLTEKQLMERGIPRDQWAGMEMGKTERRNESGAIVRVDCYQFIEYRYAYDDTVEFLRTGEFRATSLLFLCFFWPLPVLLLLALTRSSRLRRNMFIISIPVSAFMCYWLFSASFLNAENGAILAMLCTVLLFLVIITELVIDRKNLFPGKKEND